MQGLAELGHESKYVLPASVAEAARLLLRGVARAERPHASGRVETIYFDDSRLAAFDEKEASEYRKRKVRLRWYDGAGEVFLESKERFGSRRRKRRVTVPLDGERLSRLGLAALAGVSLAEWSARLGEPLAADLAPVVRLRYRRERFVAPGGERLCLDTEIEAVEATPRIGGRRGPARLAAAVFEVKGSSRELPAACAPLAELGARRGSFSKYAACVAALTE